MLLLRATSHYNVSFILWKKATTGTDISETNVLGNGQSVPDDNEVRKGLSLIPEEQLPIPRLHLQISL